MYGHDRLGEQELSEPWRGLAGGSVRSSSERTAETSAVPMCSLYRSRCFSGTTGFARGCQLDREYAGCFQITGGRQLVAADDLGMVHSDQVDGGAGTAGDLFNRLVMPVQSADADRPAVGLPLELVADGDAARGDGAGDNRSVTGQR